ncbi:MAG: hypothetical protein EZS28_000441 [Streblomastix strix]|uniref:Uncharacterized protein n=1 Tax=Streblomastix strix TaxID=222440 RepID=A0A5J4X9R6_9EUKA|nr:MAG: hypothetical protein EZS28_000441 [Streblomastix strix]
MEKMKFLIATIFFRDYLYNPLRPRANLLFETVITVQWVQSIQIYANCSCMNELEDQDNATPKNSRPILEKTKDGDVLRIFGSEKSVLRTNSSFFAQQKANIEQDDDDFIEIHNDKMNSIQLSIPYSERIRKIYVFDKGNIVAEVRRSVFYNEYSTKFDMRQFQFDHPQDGIDWLASVNADVQDLIKEDISKGPQYQFLEQLQESNAENGSSLEQVDVAMKKIKRRRLDEDHAIITEIVDIPAQQHTSTPVQQHVATAIQQVPLYQLLVSSSNQLQTQFNEEMKKCASYQSKDEEVAAKKLVQMLEGICQSHLKSFDPSLFAMTPMNRQILINKIRWKLANKIWKVLNISPPVYQERSVVIRNAMEHAGSLQHEFLDQIFQIALGRSDQLMDKVVDGYKLAFLTTGDAKRIWENTKGGTFNKPNKLENLSETTKQKLNEQRKIKQANFNIPRSGSNKINQSERVSQNWNNPRPDQRFPMQRKAVQ